MFYYDPIEEYSLSQTALNSSGPYVDAGSDIVVIAPTYDSPAI